VRAGVSFLELCKTPEARRRGDAAADPAVRLSTPPSCSPTCWCRWRRWGWRSSSPSKGPTPARAAAHAADLGRVSRFDPTARTGFVLETIQLARRDLGDTPLIGFAGAPFTVATYAIEGQDREELQRDQEVLLSRARGRAPPARPDRRGDARLPARRRSAPGAQAVQLFDSWVGVLSAEDFEAFALPPTAALVAELRATGVPVIYFGNGATSILDRVARVGASVYGVDWRMPIDEARAHLGNAAAVQGNLDPSTLLGPIADVERRARDIVRRGGKRGHVFNLGHGIYPETPIEAVEALVAAVRAA
jgi:uroporphyrinogen decarboxylase